jgi:hypothetical protein
MGTNGRLGLKIFLAEQIAVEIIEQRARANMEG